MEQIKFFILFHRFHKLVRGRDGDIEIIEPVSILLTRNKRFYIGVIDSQHSHICTAPGTTLTNSFSSCVIHCHEADWTGSHSSRGCDAIIGRAQTTE